jgi:hypothetical protein
MFLLIAVTVFFAVITSGETVALTIAGPVSVGLTWVINNYFQTKDRAAMAVTVGVSAVVTIIALLVSGDPSTKLLFSGDFSNMGELYRAGTFVVGLATLVFKFLLADRSKRSGGASK